MASQWHALQKCVEILARENQPHPPRVDSDYITVDQRGQTRLYAAVCPFVRFRMYRMYVGKLYRYVW